MSVPMFMWQLYICILEVFLDKDSDLHHAYKYKEDIEHTTPFTMLKNSQKYIFS